MKKIISVLLVSLFIFSCTDINTKLNTDPNSAYTTVPSTVLSYAQKGLSDYVNTPNVNENNFRLTMQYWQETTYADESNYDFVSRNISNNVWRDEYVVVLNNFNQAKKLIMAYSPTANESVTWPVTMKNQLAIIDMQMVYVYQTLVDTYGDVPYSKSVDLTNNQLPVYDSGAAIYTNLITRLQTDIANLDASGTSFSSGGDYFYSGDIPSWQKFGNSLLLKLGITIADSNATLAQTTVNAAISGGVFMSPADNCQFPYLSTSPNYNPIYANVIASGRHDYVAGKTIIDEMNTASDPRLPIYFDPIAGTSNFVGGTIGNPSAYASFSVVGALTRTPNFPGTVLSYTEVAFYLAEAAARWNTDAAAAAYNTAVQASFTEWGAGDATTYLTANPYNSANWKQSIGNEAWLAMYNQPIVSWTFYRRLDYPQLVAPSTAIANASGKVPVRLTYPVNESTTNPTNWKAASTAIGGDLLTTKLFWDKF